MCVFNSKNLSHEIADALTDRILRMELRPGERILEARLAKEMKVSQSSIREALRILEQSGLVETVPRRGTYVSKLSLTDITILYDVLGDLYALLIRKAMEKRSDANMEKIIDMMKRLETAAVKSDLEGYYRGMFDLALVAIDVVDSPLLKKMIFDVWPNKRRVEYITLKHRKNELNSNFKYFKLLEKYMLAADVVKLERTIRDYIRNEKETAIDIMKTAEPENLPTLEHGERK